MGIKVFINMTRNQVNYIMFIFIINLFILIINLFIIKLACDHQIEYYFGDYIE